MVRSDAREVVVTTHTDSIGSLSLTVTGCTGNGVSPIVLTVSTLPASVGVGQTVQVASVGGNTNANGAKVISAVDYIAKTVTVNGTGNGAYTSGGTIGRTYTNVQTWEAATDVDCVATTTKYIGELCADADFTYTTPAVTTYALDFEGATTSATWFRELKAWTRSSTYSMTVVDVSGDATPIVVELSDIPPSLEVGDSIVVSGVVFGSGWDIDGTHVVSAIDRTAKTITFDGSTVGTYSSGGTVTIDRPDLTSSHRWSPHYRTGVHFSVGLNNTNRWFARIAESYFRLSGVCIEVQSIGGTITSGTGALYSINSQGAIVDAVTAQCDLGTTSGNSDKFHAILHEVGLWTGSGSNGTPGSTTLWVCSNSLAIGSGTDQVGASCGFTSETPSSAFYNCGAYGIRGGGSAGAEFSGGHGFVVQNVSNRLHSCWSFESRGDDFVRSLAMGSTTPLSEFRNCASSDLSAEDINGAISPIANQATASTLRNPDGGDFRLIAGCALIDSGKTQTSFSTDIEGATRSSPWEIGPFDGFAAADNVDPTDVVSSVGATGRDYSTLAAWESATRKNCVVRNVRYVAELYDDADFTIGVPVSISGATTDSRRFRIVRPASGHEYDAVEGSGVTFTTAVSDPIDIGEEFCEFGGGIRIDNTATVTSSRSCLRVSADGVKVDGVIGVMTSTQGTDNRVLYATGSNLLISNCIAVGNSNSEGAGFGFVVDGTSNLVANCVAAKIRYSTGATAFSDNGTPGTRFRNCIAGSADVGFDVSDGYQDHNASADSSAAGFGSITSIVPASTWVDADALDFRLLFGAQVLNKGATLSGFFTEDFAGVERTGNWEMGAFGGYLVPPLYASDPLCGVGNSTGCAALCVCRIVERKDGVTYYFTDNNEPVTFRGATFDPAGSFGSSTRRSEISMKEASTEAIGAISSDLITVEDLEARRFDGASVYEFLVDLRYPWTAPIWSTLYFVDQVTFDNEQWRAQLVGISSLISQKFGRVATKKCGARLGDAMCRVDLELYTHYSVEVDTVTTDRLVFQATTATLGSTAPSGQTLTDDWFAQGFVSFLTGANAGLAFQVAGYVQSTREFTLYLKPPFPISAGDTFDVIAGCDRAIDGEHGCGPKFNNVVNFQGFPHLPGTDKMLQTPTR